MNGHDVNPFETPEVLEAHRQRKAEAAATDDRISRWKPHWFAVADLAASPYDWAQKLAWSIERKDGLRDPITDLPKLMVNGPDCVQAGAQDDHLAALPQLQPGDTAVLKLRAAAIRRDCRTQVDTLARRLATEREAVPPPDPVGLAALLAEPDEDAAYRIAEVWPTGGRVLLAAPYKAGKSTTVGNAIRSLVDGDPFLGRFDTAPVDKVVLIDTELDRRNLRRWLRDQRIQNTAAVAVLSLRGAVSTFDITDPAIRAAWARSLAGADVVILDCLRPVLDALGLSEDKDAGKVLVAFDALLAEIGAGEGMVVTHMGHQNGPASERARGDSRLLDWNDAMWNIVLGGDDAGGTRRSSYFSALGRDVELAEGKLTFDPGTRHLTYEGGSRRDSIGREAVPELLAMVAAEPGTLSRRAAVERLMDNHGVARYVARSAVDAAVKDGSLVVTLGARRAQLLSPAGTPNPSGDPFSFDGETPK
ncbi:AAA family ATPase [Mycolicibacterium aubagnense]|uniref:AAA family ATPase n=1 Tax=Mycolicibacterium aubagnense TaxID=319707 RepID=UPI0013D80558|nr:AAA family ATPase [Mycolicibacterium aubagnense]WGI34576.1 AAA family ATPase [Mycolicibacterium aubagnense]